MLVMSEQQSRVMHNQTAKMNLNQQKPIQINPSATLQNVAMSASISSTQGGGNTTTNSTGLGIKCPSANFLKAGTTAISSTTKSSTQMTQSSSNKQFQSKETPETTQRQKIRLGAATSLSSTSKFGPATTSSGSQGTTIVATSNFQTAMM